MDSSILRQIRILQICVAILSVVSVALIVSLFHPFPITQRFRTIEADKINIREADGTLKASLSNSAGFKVFGRANQDVTFSGLMFYNEEGQEEGGLVYEGRSIPGGQRASAGITFDQYRQDQNVYLHHDEYKDASGTSINDGLSVNARPDYTQSKQEYETYARLNKLPANERESAELQAAQQGIVMTPRVFVGVNRGVKGGAAYDDTGLFIRNKWGRKAIRLYVDESNKAHFEIYEPTGKSVVYELKVPDGNY